MCLVFVFSSAFFDTVQAGQIPHSTKVLLSLGLFSDIIKWPCAGRQDIAFHRTFVLFLNKNIMLYDVI